MPTADEKDKVLPEWVAHFVEYEGLITHFYLDGAGIVTVGIGCVVSLEEAKKLQFISKTKNFYIRAEHIEKDFLAVKGSLPNQVPDYYNNLTNCYLPKTECLFLFHSRVNVFFCSLKKEFRWFETLPNAAQLVVLDMAFNLGLGGFRKYVKLKNALSKLDWLTAASESHRRGISDKRNEWTRQSFLELVTT